MLLAERGHRRSVELPFRDDHIVQRSHDAR